MQPCIQNITGKLAINLTAVRHNYQLLAGRVKPATEVAAVVKANGYGLGAEQVTRALFGAGCRVFFVATLTEAEQVRAVLSDPLFSEDCTVYVFGGYRSRADFPRFARGHFIPVLFTPQQIQAWGEDCKQQGTRLPCAIKTDTGMHRLGLTQTEFASQLSSPADLQRASPVMLMSHLACGDEPDHPLNRQQLECFRQNIQQFRQHFPQAKASLANSFGTFLGEDFHFDLVRPGISLYGGNPTPAADNPMQAVVELQLPIAQVKTVTGPAHVGYGATHFIPAGSTRRIAIALGGYADGVFRHLSNQGSAAIDGHRVPLIGRVSMDSVIFDVTELPATIVDNARWLTLMDGDHGIDAVAHDAGTIGYEVLTRLGSRYHREYLT